MARPGPGLEKSWVRKHVGFTSVALVSPDLLFYLLFTSFAGVSCLRTVKMLQNGLFLFEYPVKIKSSWTIRIQRLPNEGVRLL